MAESSFDIGCKVDLQELNNAIDLARKEIANRFDFKGATAEIKLEKNEILALEASDEMRMKQMIDVLQTKMLKRGLNLKAFGFDAEFETNVSGVFKTRIPVQNGLTQDQAKKINKMIKDSKIKVQSRINGDSLRVSSKSKDDLQRVQKMLRDADLDFAVAFDNYR